MPLTCPPPAYVWDISSCKDLKLNKTIDTFPAATGISVPRHSRLLGLVSVARAVNSHRGLLTILVTSRRFYLDKELLLVELVMMLLEIMPFFFWVHLLHFFAEIDVLSSQNLESLIKPLESLKHCHASLLPEHWSDLCLVCPHLLFLLLLHVVKLTMLIVTQRHGLARWEKLRVSIDVLLDVEGWRLYKGSIGVHILLLLMRIVGIWGAVPNCIWIIIHLLAVHLIMLYLRMSRGMMVGVLGIVLAIAHAGLWVVGIGLWGLCGVACFLVGKWLLRMCIHLRLYFINKKILLDLSPTIS